MVTLLPYQAYQHLNKSELKERHAPAYNAYLSRVRKRSTPTTQEKDCTRWGNEHAALDLENETDEVKAEVQDYLQKYNSGEVKNEEEYRALINNDQDALEQKRVERLRKLQTLVNHSCRIESTYILVIGSLIAYQKRWIQC